MAEQLMREDSEERGSDGAERTSDEVRRTSDGGEERAERAEGEEPKTLDDIIEAYAAE